MAHETRMLFLRTAMRRVARRVDLPAMRALLTAGLLAGASGGFVIEASGQQPGVTASGFLPRDITRQNRRLEQQLEALAADEAWSETLELLEGVASEPSSFVESAAPDAAASPLADTTGHNRWVPLSDWRQRRIATLPEAARQTWNDRVGSTARRRLEDAIARLDERELARIAEEFFATPSANEALLAASELAMERGDHTAARRWLGRLHPLASDPFGRPAGVAMVTIDPAADPAALAEAWRSAPRPADLLTAPVDEELLPTVLARLALISVREGDFRRAAGEVQILRALAPAATGRIAGREQPIAEALEALIASGEARPAEGTYGLLRHRWDVVRPPATPEENAIANALANARKQQAMFNQRLWMNRPALAQQITRRARSLATSGFRAVATDDAAFYLKGNHLRRISLKTGESAPFALPGIETPKTPTDVDKLAADPARPADRGAIIRNNGGRLVINGPAVINGQAIQANGRQVIQVAPNGQIRQRPAEPPQSRATGLSTADGLLIAHITAPPPNVRGRRLARGRFPGAKTSLLAVDPQDPAEPVFRLEPPATEGEESPWAFARTLVTRGDRLYTLVGRNGVRREVGIACYSLRRAELIWLKGLGSGSTPLNSSDQNGGITLAGDTVYALTATGGVAALDAITGEIRWLATTPRTWSAPFARTSPPQLLVESDRVLASPAGSDRLIAWDAATGRPLWDAPRPTGSAIVGSARRDGRSVVVLAGRRVASYDTLTGQRIFAWPDSDHAGLRGLGSAAVHGNEVFWPTRNTLYSLEATTGRMTRPPLDVTGLGPDGADLFATDHGLLIAGQKRIRLLSDRPIAEKEEPEAGVSRLMEPSRSTQTAQLATP